MEGMLKLSKILLINPYSTIHVYSKSKVKVPVSPSLTLATLAAPLLEKTHTVEILDLTISENPKENLLNKLKEFNPEFVGITFPTSSMLEMKEIATVVKEFNKNIILIGGGPHATAEPKNTLLDSPLDILVIGEGDFILPEIIENKNLSSIKGIAYKKNKRVVITERRDFIQNLDDLPMPAWYLFDLSEYISPKSLSKSPLGSIETSRGCPFGCTYCNKKTFGRIFRTKSLKRIVDEMAYMKELGFKEIYIADDGFTTDLQRAKEICDLIVSCNLNITWNLGNGIRVDMIDEEFLKKAKLAGCHRIHFGIESANPQILKEINKGITTDQVRNAFRLCKRTGMDSVAYFMFGFPSESEETMKQGIKLAKEIDPTFARVSILIPYPGTELWEDWDKEGIIKDKDWSKYTFHNVLDNIYEHPNLDIKTIQKYYKRFYREFYYRPSYMFKRFTNGLKKGNLVNDIKYFIENFLGG